MVLKIRAQSNLFIMISFLWTHVYVILGDESGEPGNPDKNHGSGITRKKLDIGNIKCYSCSSLDEQPYSSQYFPMVKLQPMDVCNDPFPDLSPSVPKERSYDLMMHERLLICNQDSAGSIEPGRKNNLSFHCIKITGIDKETGSNVTTRGCFLSPEGYVPDRDHIDSGDITFGRYHIRGTAYFCSTDGCNSGKQNTASLLFRFLVFIVGVMTVISLT